jgi:hypothetical protein
VSSSPAAGLARLRVLFPKWVFSRVELENWSGYIARRSPRDGDELVIAEKSLGALELALRGKPGRT